MADLVKYNLMYLYIIWYINVLYFIMFHITYNKIKFNIDKLVSVLLVIRL